MSALRAGMGGFRNGEAASQYVVAGRPVRCPHCGHGTFGSGRALLNTTVRSLFNVDWLDPSASMLVCSECGRIEWFAQEPERLE